MPKSPVKRKKPSAENDGGNERAEMTTTITKVEASSDEEGGNESKTNGETVVMRSKESSHKIFPGLKIPEKALRGSTLNPEDDPHYIRAATKNDDGPFKKAKIEKDENQEDETEVKDEKPDVEEDGDKVQRRVLNPEQERIKYYPAAKDDSRRLIVILEKANLETIKVRPTSLKGEDGFKNFEGHELLNCEDHMNFIRKYRKDPAFCRPDITHQCLLMLMDSPLNRANLLQVYIHTANNVLIEVHPQTRLPRTFKRWANLMVQLLHKLSIRSAQKDRHKLLSVIKNPITSHLPPGCRKIGTSFSKTPEPGKLLEPRKLVDFARRPTDSLAPPPNPNKPYDHKDDGPVCVVIGAMAHGSIEDLDYIDECVSISKYPLSAALTATKIVSAFEEIWGIH